MMNRGEEEKNKLSEMCGQLGFSEEEKEAAMAFFSGEAGEEVLTKIHFRDLSGTSSGALETMMYELTRKEKTAELGKLFLLLFAAGQSTCWRLLREKAYIRKKLPSDVDPAKAAAVYGAELGMSAYYLSAYSLVELMELMDDAPGTIRQMLDYEKSGTEDGKLVLLAAYFQKKYRCDGQPQTVKEEDRKLLEEYETALAECLCRFYAGVVEQEALKELSECIWNGGRPQQFLSSTGIAQAPGRQFRLAVGAAYLNYPLSDRLKNIVRICMEVNQEETLDNMHSISSKFPMALNRAGGDYDRVFGIDSTDYIRWAMKKSMDHILEEQAVSNPESYLHILDEADTGNANRMLWYIKQGNPALYARMVAEKREEYKERVIAELIRKDLDGEVTKTYLRGEGTAEVLYPYFSAATTNRYYDGGREYVLLSDFQRNFEDEEFYRRCEVYMLSRHANIFFRNQVTASDGKETHLDKESVKKLFMDFTEEGAALCYQMLAVSALHESMYAGMEQDLLDGLAGYFSGCLKERRQETLEVFAGADAYGRFVGLNMLVREAEQNKEEILKYSQDSSEIVKEELFGFLCAQKGWEEDVKKLLASKKAAQREFAVRVLLCWQKDGADYRELFAQAMEKEKSAKVRELLGNALSRNGEDESGRQAASREELVKSLHRGGRKRSLAWAYETPFPAVRMADGGAVKETGAQEAKSGSAGDTGKKDAQEPAADEEYLQAILLCYVSSDAAAAKEGIAAKEANASADGCGVSRNAEFLAEVLNAGDLAVYMNALFDRWLAAGAEVKKRWVLYAAAIHGGSEIVEKLERKIREWPQQSRGAIACEAVKALSLNPLPQALLVVDGIARKFKYKQVRAAAAGALEFAAAQLGITREELADRIVPDFGFDENMERQIDYGTRSFIVTITPTLEIEVFEAAKTEEATAGASKAAGGKASGHGNAGSGFVRGKKLKNLPAPGGRDDEAKAKAAYEEFKLLKKQLKTTAASQKARLEMALSANREWSVDAWKRLFVKNPVMHQFAIGLIWGVYEGGKLVQSFRYMEDGSFNTEGEEEYVFPDLGKIGLVHPIELTGKVQEAWNRQLEDYEITQPFEQMKRAVYLVTEEEAGQKRLARFEGRTLNDLSLGSRLSGLGWYRGSVQDGGGFYTWYREDAELGLGVELHFSGSYVGGSNDDVTIYDARFYRAGTIKRGSYEYDEAGDDKAYFLRDIPARYFSEVVWQLERATMG